MQKKKGVSLIVLVITVIVMVILAGTIILTINNTGIMVKAEGAVAQHNLAEVQTLASVKWAEAFLEGYTTTQQLEVEVPARLAQEGIDLSKYNVEISAEGVTVSLKGAANWVVATVDGVPIPKGFVASSVTGENTKNGGLVIYEGTEPVTAENVETARRTRNQYVWVTVPKESFTTKFVRGAYDNTTYSNVLGKGEWEVVLDTTTNMPLSTQDANYVSAQTLKEVQAMYASVKEYEGFYIARYEAGIDTPRTSNTTLVKGSSVYSMMGKIPYTHIPWGTSNLDDTNGAVEVARSIYPAINTNYGVVSTLTYGVQWDRTLAWWLEVGAKDVKGNVVNLKDSTSYGNYYNHVIASGDLNDGSRYATVADDYEKLNSYQVATSSSTRNDGEEWALTTGALKASKVNNIYDMAGNMSELTMEARTNMNFNIPDRYARGGYFIVVEGDIQPVTYADNSNNAFFCSFRTSLYIKK